MGIQIKKIDSLNVKEKVFLIHKIFDYWLKGFIKNKGKAFLPEDLNIYNSKDISKVFLICSRTNYDDKIKGLFKYFKDLNYSDKLDFMAYLFNDINGVQIVPTYITYNLNFKDLSDKILQYK